MQETDQSLFVGGHAWPFVRLTACLAVATLLLAGCVGLPTHEDRTTFDWDEGLDTLVAHGASVRGAREDPSGGSFAGLPMQDPGLDAAWGAKRYALTSIHWWGPPGPPGPDAQPDGQDGAPASTTIDSSTWQGFHLGQHQVQVIPGDFPTATVRGWYDAFLANVTSLRPDARAAAADELLGDCDPMACTAPLPGGLDAVQAWQSLGGLEAAAVERADVGLARFSFSSWWFAFEWDVATLEDREGLGSTTLRAGSGGVAEFVWRSGRTHSDEASYAKLEEMLEPLGRDAPPPESLVWVHQEIQYDG